MTERKAAAIELLRRRARVDLLAFVQWCWDRPFPFQVGRHTRAYCEWFNQAVEKWQRGESSYCLFNTPPRHGKSDLCQFSEAFFLGVTRQWHTSSIYTGYGATLVKGFSRRVQQIIESDAYRALFPEVRLADDNASVDTWSLAGSTGVQTFAGLGGGLTGKGAHLAIVDDYCKSAEEADSETMREKVWEGFAADLMTRQMPPASIVVVTATPWHMDDLTCRIRKHTKDDPSFPRFDQLCFPAQSDEYETLFPELYDLSWYERQRATLGSVRWSAMFLCNPVGDGVRLFKDEWLNYYTTVPTGTTNYILVDTAGSMKRKHNDYLVMLVFGVGKNGVHYLLDMERDKMSLIERTEKYARLVQKWRPAMTWWEQVGAQTDLEHVKIELDRVGIHTPIRALAQRVPKEGRIRWLESKFEQGLIFFPPKIVKQQCDGRVVDVLAEAIEDEYKVYPSSSHDDWLDDMANMCHPDVAPTLKGYENRHICLDKSSKSYAGQQLRRIFD